MQELMTQARAFFEADASEERKGRLQSNLAALGPGASPVQQMFAQTPMRFFDMAVDAAPLFAGAELQPEFLPHVMGTLVQGWDVTRGSRPLSVPLFIAQGRYDYTVPYTLWDGIVPRLPTASFQLFDESGHQPFFEEPAEFTARVLAWLEASTTAGVR